MGSLFLYLSAHSSQLRGERARIMFKGLRFIRETKNVVSGGFLLEYLNLYLIS